MRKCRSLDVLTRGERWVLIVIKCSQLVLSIYFLFTLHQFGNHWIILTGCLAVPIHGAFLLLGLPREALDNSATNTRCRALEKLRVRIHIDAVVSGSMGIMLLCLTAILLFGYFHVHSSVATNFLLTTLATLLLSLLYLLNAVLDVRRLQAAKLESIDEHKDTGYLCGYGEGTLFFTKLDGEKSVTGNSAEFLSIRSPIQHHLMDEEKACAPSLSRDSYMLPELGNNHGCPTLLERLNYQLNSQRLQRRTEPNGSEISVDLSTKGATAAEGEENSSSISIRQSPQRTISTITLPSPVVWAVEGGNASPQLHETTQMAGNAFGVGAARRGSENALDASSSTSSRMPLQKEAIGESSSSSSRLATEYRSARQPYNRRAVILPAVAESRATSYAGSPARGSERPEAGKGSPLHSLALTANDVNMVQRNSPRAYSSEVSIGHNYKKFSKIREEWRPPSSTMPATTDDLASQYSTPHRKRVSNQPVKPHEIPLGDDSLGKVPLPAAHLQLGPNYKEAKFVTVAPSLGSHSPSRPPSRAQVRRVPHRQPARHAQAGKGSSLATRTQL